VRLCGWTAEVETDNSQCRAINQALWLERAHGQPDPGAISQVEHPFLWWSSGAAPLAANAKGEEEGRASVWVFKH
jgi:hypothetical protein